MPSLTLRPRLFVRTGALAAALAVAGAATGVAFADTVVMRVGPLDGVEITGVKDGKVQFKNRGTGAERQESLGKIKGFQVDGVDALAAALKLAQDKQDKPALLKFNAAIGQAKAAKKLWLAPYIQQQIMACHKRLGDVRPAAQAWLELAQLKADAFFFDETQPTAQPKPDPALMDLVKAADENTRRAIYDMAKAARGKTDAGHQGFVDALAGATGITEPAPAPAPTAVATTPVPAGPGAVPGPGAGKEPSAPAAPVTVKAGSLLLPVRILRDIQENSASARDIQLAVAGRYTEAAKAMRAALRAQGDLTAVRLFVLGRVVQEMAEQEKDAAKKADLLAEAGECFGRVGAQFNEPDSSFYAPSLLEFARVNAALGNLAAAKKAMSEIGDFANAKDEPAYIERYKAFQATLGK